MRTRSTHSTEEILPIIKTGDVSRESLNLKKSKKEPAQSGVTVSATGDMNEVENPDTSNQIISEIPDMSPTEASAEQEDKSNTGAKDNDDSADTAVKPFVAQVAAENPESTEAHEEVEAEITESSSCPPDKSGKAEEDQVSPAHQSHANKESQAKKENFLSVFRPDPTSFFAGPLEKEFAKSFYNSLNMLACQAISNGRMEADAGHASGYKRFASKLSNGTDSLQAPKRNDSRSSDGSRSSHDAPNGRRNGSPDRIASLSPSGGEDVHRPLPGISPKSLAEQLRSSDSASMVVSRQHKFAGRNPGYSDLYPNSDPSETPPNAYLNANYLPSSPRSSDYPTMSSSGHVTPSSSLHHFTTRYTIEKPADPSRLGVELVLDHVNEEPVIEVECGGNRGLLYVNKLCQGSKGQSIHFNDEWLTPNEFQFISGRETAKDWKRSIRHCGKSLKTLMTKGILQVHPPICECAQCRDLHGSKLLHGKKLSLKNCAAVTSKPIKIQSHYDDGRHSDADEMTRHGYEGSLNSIISQLHKASGFESNSTPDTLDLSSKSHCRRGTPSPSPQNRKRSREESDRRSSDDHNDRRRSASPSPKRPYSRQDGYASDSMHAHSPNSFTAAYALMPPEEQYRQMLALVSRSFSPGEQHRQFLNLAQTMGNPLGMGAAHYGDYSGHARSLNTSDSKGKNRRNGDNGFHLFDYSKQSKKTEPNSDRRGAGSATPDKYRRPMRSPASQSRADQKYIALESRQREERPGRSVKDDVRSWTASRHAAMIELNSRQHTQNEWHRKSQWQNDRGQYQAHVKNPSSRVGKRDGNSRDSAALDRAPISKTPVTTLHHRPSRNDGDDSNQGGMFRLPQKQSNGTSKLMPMLDLQKHAVPMLSLKRPTEENLLGDTDGRKTSSNRGSDADVYGGASSPAKRQSSSAPPPFVSTDIGRRQTTRPTSAQDRISTSLLEPMPGNHDFTSNGNVSSSPTYPSRGAPYESYLLERSKVIQMSLDRMKAWNTEDVCNFIRDIDPSIAAHIEDFKKHEIDGEGFPLLTDRHLMEIMDIKLGCALKIVARVKRELNVLPESLSCSHHWLMPSFHDTDRKIPSAVVKQEGQS